MKDIFFLNQRSEPATEADKQVAVDLLDTLKAHEEGCVGMAANMIGVKKCIIAVNMGFMNVAMFNPKIVKRSGKYETEEGCLSCWSFFLQSPQMLSAGLLLAKAVHPESHLRYSRPLPEMPEESCLFRRFSPICHMV